MLRKCLVGLAVVVLSTPILSACSNRGEATPPLRRLSHTEYRNTLGDLFPGVELPEPSLTPELTINGLENNAAGSAVSLLLVEQYRTHALVLSAHVMDRISSFMPCAEESEACARQFVEVFGARVFRRPLRNDEVERYEEILLDRLRNGTIQEAVQETLLLFLQAPQFLYHTESVTPRNRTEANYAMASRLSYFLWASMPDERLFEAAERKRLLDPDEVEAQVRRMLANPKARTAVLDLHRQWLNLDRLNQVNKNPAAYPEFNEDLRRSMRISAERTLEHIIFDGDGTLRALLTGTEVWTDADLATLLGVSRPPEGEWQQRTLPDGERMGFLSHPAFLAAQSHPLDPSPVLRGNFIRTRLLCDPVPPPGAAVDTTPPGRDDFPEETTNRQRYEQRAADPECAGCHDRINPFGYVLEAYDSIGRFRTMDGELPVDTAVTVSDTDVSGAIDSPAQLAQRLAASSQVQRCVVTQWLRYALARTELPDDRPLLDRVTEHFAATDGSITELMFAIATSPEFAVAWPPPP